MVDPPVTPAVSGTFDAGPRTKYTVGREHVQAVLVEMMRKDRRFACDIETFGLGPLAKRIKCVTFAHADHAVVLDPRDPPQANLIRKTMEHVSELTFHNAPFDVTALVHNGLMTVDQIDKVVDTLVWARLADPDERSRKSLDVCAEKMLGATGHNLIVAVFRAQKMTKSQGFYDFDIDRMEYLNGAVSDGLVTAALRPVAEAAGLRQLTEGHPFGVWGVKGEEAHRLVWREQRINRLMIRRSCIGLRADFDFLDDYEQRTTITAKEAETALIAAGVRPGVGTDLAARLEEMGELPADHPRTPTGKFKTTADDLQRLNHPLARQFVEHKQITKILNDYLVKIRTLADANERIHPTCAILAAATGRMSYSDPPLQQFPGPARGILVPDIDDTWTSIDWSQIEPVVCANIAGEQAILEGYENGTSDLYTDVATMAGGIPRKTAKVVLLAQLYGEGIRKLALDLKITEDEAKELKAAIFRAMPRVKDLSFKWKRISEEHQKVFTLSGRILPIPMSTWNGETSVAAYKGTNYAVQGSAYDILAEAVVAIDEAGLGSAVQLLMHDEIVCSSDAAHDIRKIMETPPARLCELAGRIPVLRTDMTPLGDRWNVG